MELQAKLHSIATDWKTNKTLITFEIEQGFARKAIETIKDKILRLTVKRWVEKRGNEANKYYWQLLTQLAKVLGWSNARAHNYMLQHYGVPESIGGEITDNIWLPDNDATDRHVMEETEYHLCPTSNVLSSKRRYMLMRGSHRYDKAEFSRLINGLVDECKELDIPTESPDEIAHMMELYKGAC